MSTKNTAKNGQRRIKLTLLKISKKPEKAQENRDHSQILRY